MIANGQLRHHFWGEYYATIVLIFSSKEEAEQAQRTVFTNWKQHDEILSFHGTGDQLTVEEERLVAHGADRKKLTSLAKSIDRGEPFTVTVQ